MKKGLFVFLITVLVQVACVAQGAPPAGETAVPPESSLPGQMTTLPESTPAGNIQSPPESTAGATATPLPAAQPTRATDELAALQSIFTVPVDPIQVLPTLDDERRAEAVIVTGGGSLSVTGADGTTYRLDIPAGALADDTLVRMTPLSELEGMPFGGDVYAVQVEPDGLEFYDSAILTITPPQELSVDQQILFGYQGQGENLVLVPPVVGSKEIQIQLLHFSGYGVTKGFLADIEPVRARIGGDAESRLQSAIAEQLMKARMEQLMGITDGTTVDWEGFFQQWEEQVVKPRIAAAGESCAAGRLAVQTLLSYERQRQLLGMGESSVGTGSAVVSLSETAAEVCMKEEYELCRDEHIVHRIVPAWLGLERQFALLGAAGEGAPSARSERAADYVRRCLTFELEFHSEASLNSGKPDGYDSVVDSKIKIQFSTDDLSMRGQAPLVNTAFEFRSEGCTVTNNRGGDTFEVIDLAYISDTKSPTDAVGYVQDFRMVYYPGNTTESFSISCPPDGAYTSPPAPWWTGIYLPLHQGEMSPSEGGLIAEDWEIFGDEYFAKKEWIREDAGEGIVEVGTFKLYHRPG